MPGYYNLPENDERRRLQRELRENTDKTVPGYQAYAEAMEELDKLMDAYSEMDKWGVPRQIDEAGKKELTEAMTKAALAGEKLLENAGAPDKKGDPAVQSTAETVKKIQAMMSRDMNLLQQYDPNGAEKKSLPELQQDARTVTVDLSGKEMDKMRGAQSDRIPMTLKDAKGNPLLDSDGKPKMIEVFNFGKHKGLPVADVLHIDPGYYSWILSGDFTYNTKQVLTRIRLREAKLNG